jgi:hypothetical protein
MVLAQLAEADLLLAGSGQRLNLFNPGKTSSIASQDRSTAIFKSDRQPSWDAEPARDHYLSSTA